MKTENWDKAKEIFGHALGLSPEERLRYLDQVCADDPDMRREIESLLSSLNTAESFMETPAGGEFAKVAQVPPDKFDNFVKPETLVGQILDGRFLIEKDLTDGGADAGGIGLVYLAKDLKLLSKNVVVKILQKAALKNENIVRKFLHEKEALIRLDHPNIVRILDSGTLSDGNPFMVMEFIEGYSLRRKLRENKILSLNECANLIEKISNALSAAHSKKVLHRDLKPENVMLTPQEDGYERVRLIDFGIARVEDSQLAPATSIPQAIGTILYMAPEQLEGKLEQTPAADIYASAIVAYEILTGKLPFKPNSLVELFQLQKAGLQTPPSQFRPEISVEVDRIIIQALSLHPADRPPDARIFGKELATALRHTEVLTKDAEAPIKTDNITEMSVITSEAAFPLPSVSPPPAQFLSDNNIPEINRTEVKAKRKLGAYLGLGILILAAIASLLTFAIWKNSITEVLGTANNAVPNPKTATNANITANANTTNINSENANITNINSENANTSTKTEKTSASPRRELAFHLVVQKMRDGKPFGSPFQSSGQEIFENGYKFKMALKPDAAGFVYLFNEDKDAQGNPIFNILYPTPKTNQGSAEILVKEEIETNFNTFSGTQGTEIVWLIWTATKHDELEAARLEAFSNQGLINAQAKVQKLKNFLGQKNETESSKDTANQQTIIKGLGETMVHRIELEHR